MATITKPAAGFPRYLLDTKGNITDTKTGRPITVFIHKRCPTVTISDGEKFITVQFARLIMMTFNPCEMSRFMEVHHMDGNRLNNELGNLIWAFPNQHRLIHKYMNNQRQLEFDFGDW